MTKSPDHRRGARRLGAICLTFAFMMPAPSLPGGRQAAGPSRFLVKIDPASFKLESEPQVPEPRKESAAPAKKRFFTSARGIAILAIAGAFLVGGVARSAIKE